MQEPIFANVLQICVVVRDVHEAAKNYYDMFGIGPWRIDKYSPENTTEMSVHGEKIAYSMFVATTQIGNVQWELVQPLDDKTIYAEFLKEHGEGIHHVAFDTPDFQRAIKHCHEKGAPVIQTGRFAGYGFAYIDTRKQLGMISEVYDPPDNYHCPPPMEQYPPSDDT